MIYQQNPPKRVIWKFEVKEDMRYETRDMRYEKDNKTQLSCSKMSEMAIKLKVLRYHISTCPGPLKIISTQPAGNIHAFATKI
jgi:hypothetical protein